MTPRKLHLTAPLLALALLNGGCAGPAPRESAGPVAAEAAVEQKPPATLPAERLPVPIPDESLLPLLEAEFALRGGQFGHALTLLSQQIQVLTDPDLARRTLRLAEFLRDDQQALAAAVRLSALDLQDGAAAATAMMLLTRQGQVTDALGYARTARERGTRINAPALVADFDNLSASDRAAVASAIEALAEEWPGDVDIVIARALLYRQTLDTEKAIATIASLLDDQPDEERSLVLWTQLQLDSGSDEPFTRMADAVGRKPENERLRLQYARLLAANEQFALAGNQFSALIEQSPRNDEYLMAGAMIDLELDNFESAIESLKSLIALGQRLPEAFYYLGRTHEKSGDDNAAIAAYGLVGSSREFVDAKRRAGGLVMDLEDETALASFFDEQRSQFPEESARLFQVEAELIRTLTQPGALAVYDEALSRFPTAVSLRYGRAMLREATGDYAGMEADLRAILADNPDNATTLNALGYTLTNHTTRYDEAAALIERALAITPREPAMLDSLGWVYFKMGRLPEAENILREAYNLLPDPEVAAHLGEALWAQGKLVEARDVWQAGLTVDASNTHIQNTIQRLGVVLD